MQGLREFWQGLRLLPSAWLLMLQFCILILSMISNDSGSYRGITWALGVLVLLVIAKVIRYTPMFTILGLSFVGGALIFSVFIFIGADSPTL